MKISLYLCYSFYWKCKYLFQNKRKYRSILCIAMCFEFSCAFSPYWFLPIPHLGMNVKLILTNLFTEMYKCEAIGMNNLSERIIISHEARFLLDPYTSRELPATFYLENAAAIVEKWISHALNVTKIFWLLSLTACVILLTYQAMRKKILKRFWKCFHCMLRMLRNI